MIVTWGTFTPPSSQIFGGSGVRIGRWGTILSLPSAPVVWRETLVHYAPVGRSLAATLTDPASGAMWNVPAAGFLALNPGLAFQYAIPMVDVEGRGRYVAQCPILPGLRDVEVAYYDIAGPFWTPGDLCLKGEKLGWTGGHFVSPSLLWARLGGPTALRNTTLTGDGKRLASYDTVVYDTAANALTNDGITGAIDTSHVDNLFDDFANILESIITPEGVP